MYETQFRLALAILLSMVVCARLYYQRSRKGFEKVVIKHEKREKFLIELFALGLVPILFYLLTSSLDPFNLPLPAEVRWLGGVLIFMGNLLFIWSHRALGKNWSPLLEIRKGHILVTKGPYRFIRHPMYTSIFLIGTGISILSANWIVSLSYMLPATIMYLIRISDEEEMMIERFGNEYTEYIGKTGRLVPKLRILRDHSKKRP